MFGKSKLKNEKLSSDDKKVLEEILFDIFCEKTTLKFERLFDLPFNEQKMKELVKKEEKINELLYGKPKENNLKENNLTSLKKEWLQKIK